MAPANGLPNPIQFDPQKIGTIKPPLKASKGYYLSPEELQDIFGINQKRFGELPKRLVVPVLTGSHYTEQWHQVSGTLFLVEPIAWVPQVSMVDSLPVTAFSMEFNQETVTVSHTAFNAGASAEISVSAGGTYAGISATAKANASMSLAVAKSETVTKTIKERGSDNTQALAKLVIYPLLECRVIKKQAMRYTVNGEKPQLKWSPDSENNEQWWKDRWVGHDQLGPEVNALQWHPVPMEGSGLPDRARILCVPQIRANGEVDVITLLVHSAWGPEWFRYDAPWEPVQDDQIMTLAVPNNPIAFLPAATWTALPNLDV